MMSSLFLTMTTLFLIGTHLSWVKEEPRSNQPAKENPQQRSVNEEVRSVLPGIITSHPPPRVPVDVLERLRRRKPPHEFLNEMLKEQEQQLGKFPHKGRFPLSDLPDQPIVRIDPWRVWNGWVTPDHFYPEGVFYSEEMNQILNAMATSPVTELGVGYKGTQLKATMMLGGQRTVFKPKRCVWGTIFVVT